MTDRRVYVTEAQEEAARLIAERNKAQGTGTSDSVLRIASVDKRLSASDLAYAQSVFELLSRAAAQYEDGRFVDSTELMRRVPPGSEWRSMLFDGAVERGDGSRRALVEVKANLDIPGIAEIRSRFDKARTGYDAQMLLISTQRLPNGSEQSIEASPGLVLVRVNGSADFDALVTAVGLAIGR